MKKTLLELTQQILSDMDSDEVNSIGDTTESMQVANIVRETWEHVYTKGDFPENYELFQLDASGSVLKPTRMSINTNVSDIKWLKYDCRENGATYAQFKELVYLPLLDFLDRMHNLPDATDSHIGEFTESTSGSSVISFFYYNNKAPEFYTTFNDNIFIFDSYDNTVDTTLQKSKTLGYGKVIPTFQMTDTYVPALDSNLFPLLLQEAKAQAFNELRQMDNPRADKRAREHWIKSQQSKQNIGGHPAPYWRKEWLPNYGRK